MDSHEPDNKLYAKSINIPFSTSHDDLSLEHNIQSYNTFSYSEDNSIQSAFDNDILKDDLDLKNRHLDNCSIVFKKNDLKSSNEINKRNKTSALSSALRASHPIKNNNNNHIIAQNTITKNSEIIQIDNNNDVKYNPTKTVLDTKVQLNHDIDINDNKPPKVETKNSINIITSIEKNPLNSTIKSPNKLSLVPYDKGVNLNVLRFANSDTNLLPNQKDLLLSDNIDYSHEDDKNVSKNHESFKVNQNKNNNICEECQKQLKLKNQLNQNHHHHHHDNYVSMESPVKISNVNSIDIIGAGNDRNSITTNTLNRMLNSPSYSQLSIMDRPQPYTLNKIKNKDKGKVIVKYYPEDETINKMNISPQTVEEKPSNNDKVNFIKEDMGKNEIKKEIQSDNKNINGSDYPSIDKKIYSLSLNDSDILKDNTTSLSSLSPLHNKSNLFENEIALFHPQLTYHDSDIDEDQVLDDKRTSKSNHEKEHPDKENILLNNDNTHLFKDESDSIAQSVLPKDRNVHPEISITPSPLRNNTLNNDSETIKTNNTNTKNDHSSKKESPKGSNNEIDEDYNKVNNQIVIEYDSGNSISLKKNNILSSSSSSLLSNKVNQEKVESNQFLKRPNFNYSQSNADLNMNKSMSVLSLEMENDDKTHLLGLNNDEKGSFDGEDMKACSFENEDELIDNIFDKNSPTSLPLLPYGHQVGGHAPFLRFSDKALCKLMNPAEKAFYESINDVYPQLRPFIPGYYGVINVYFNNGNSGSDNTWADNIPVAIIENEGYHRRHSMSIDPTGKSSSQSLSTSPYNNNYLSADHHHHHHHHHHHYQGSFHLSYQRNKINISPSLSHNASESSLHPEINQGGDINTNTSTLTDTNEDNITNNKIPTDYLSSYTDGDSRFHFNFYQKLRERVLRDALTAQNRRFRYSQLRANSAAKLAKLKRRHSLNALTNSEYQGFTPLVENNQDLPSIKNNNSNNNNSNNSNNLNNDTIPLDQNINPWSLHCLNNQINKLGQNEKDGEKPQQFILIEDLTYGMKYPCILDLKMGTRQHGVDATPQKRKSQEKKCESTTSKLFGVRMCGMQVYKTNTKTFEYSDKYKGRKIVASHFKEGLLSFLDNGEQLLVGFIPKIVEKLKHLYSVVEQLTTSRFYASSLMLFYDGAWADGEIENDESNFYMVHDSNDELNNNEEDEDSYSTVKHCLMNKEVVVHLIDFAHCTNEAHLMVSTDPKKRGDIDITKPVYNPVTGKEENYILVPFPPTHKGPDMGYLLGIRNLIMFFEEIYKDFGAKGHVFKKDFPEIFNKQDNNSNKE